MGDEARAGRLRHAPLGAEQGASPMAELFDTPAFERRLELARIRRAISLGNRAAEGTPAGDGARVLELAPGGPPVLLAVAEARPLPAPEVPEAVGAGRGRIAVIGVIFAAGLALGL
ncbi:MAG TPA: hypothetical protein PLH75_01250, partial [Amaricoccus sp.]|nr:hypothetical protein [Amaricoccus sp.]